MELLIDTPWFKVERSADEMTYKVTSKEKAWRTKTFKGETAWSDAQRYLNDNIIDNDEVGYQAL